MDVLRTRSESIVPDKGARVTVRLAVDPHKLTGRTGTVERFYIGHLYSVGVVLDGSDDGIHAFRPEELTVIV